MKRVVQSLVLLASMALCQASLAQIDGPVASDDLVFCTTCHGVQLMGNAVIKAPRLSGMETWYVEQQLRNFKNSILAVAAADGPLLIFFHCWNRLIAS